jgi:hypothetical protein
MSNSKGFFRVFSPTHIYLYNAYPKGFSRCEKPVEVFWKTFKGFSQL